MKTRLELAHEYAMAYITESLKVDLDFDFNHQLISLDAFSYADAMLAENENRKYKTTLTTLQQTFINGVEQPRYAPCVEEWQPDWGLAPDGYDWFCVGSETNNGYFCNIEPKTFKDKYWFVGEDSIEIINHGYTGNWRESLRKRPEGK